MAGPAIINGRFFQRIIDAAWLQRVDTQTSLSVAEVELHCAAEYGFPVRAVAESLPAAQWDSLVALRMMWAIAPPMQPPPPLTPEQVAWAAATLAEKVTMIGQRLGFLP